MYVQLELYHCSQGNRDSCEIVVRLDKTMQLVIINRAHCSQGNRDNCDIVVRHGNTNSDSGSSVIKVTD